MSENDFDRCMAKYGSGPKKGCQCNHPSKLGSFFCGKHSKNNDKNVIINDGRLFLKLNSGIGMYEGDYAKGYVPDGNGKMCYRDGSIYIGEWLNGLREGKGLFLKGMDNEWEYVGEWEDDKQNGNGVLTNKNTGTSYTGGWKDDQENGIGVRIVPGEYKYEGEWTNGKTNGNGVYYYSNGNNYFGEVKSNKRHGYGTMVYCDGVYEGEWMNDKREGKGTCCYYKTNSEYTGEWKQDRHNGYGTYIELKTGNIYKGDWVNSKKQGKGEIEYSRGYTYEGQFHDNSKNGTGKIRSTLFTDFDIMFLHDHIRIDHINNILNLSNEVVINTLKLHKNLSKYIIRDLIDIVIDYLLF